MNYKIPQSNFLGKPMEKGKSYTIVGGGISGLFLGYFLKKNGVAVKIVEQSENAGGLLQTQKTEFGLVERAANGFIWCREIQEICDDLNLQILPPKSTSKARYIVKNGTLRKIPLSLGDGFQLAKAFMKKHAQPFETMEDFGKHFLGKKLTAQILEPAFSGIYGAPAEQLSFPGAMSKLAKAFNETKYLRPAFKKMKGNFTASEKKKRAAGTHCFKNGMGELTDRLAAFLKNEIEWNVDGRQLAEEKGNLILTTPAHIAKDFFKNKNQIIHDSLSQIRYNSMISVTLFFPKNAFEKFKIGFGCLIPKAEGLNILGVLFNSYIFDNRVSDDNLMSLTCILRDDSPQLDWFTQDEENLKSLIINDLNQLFVLKENPVHVVFSKWEKGIPLYSPTLYQSWFSIDENLRTDMPNRNLFGNYTGEISVRGLAQSSHGFI